MSSNYGKAIPPVKACRLTMSAWPNTSTANIRKNQENVKKQGQYFEKIRTVNYFPPIRPHTPRQCAPNATHRRGCRRSVSPNRRPDAPRTGLSRVFTGLRPVPTGLRPVPTGLSPVAATPIPAPAAGRTCASESHPRSRNIAARCGRTCIHHAPRRHSAPASARLRARCVAHARKALPA